MRGGGAAAHPAAQLVQLREAHALGVLDDHQAGARHVDADLDHRGGHEELDLAGTIRGTAEKGYLDIRMVPERHNAVKVLMFFDVGGSMDWHIAQTEELLREILTELGDHIEEMASMGAAQRARKLQSRFAAEYPVLERIAREIADTLSKMGI